MSARRSIYVYLPLGWAAVIFFGCGSGSKTTSQSPIQATQAPIQVTKQPVNFVMRTFDPSSPPPEMPPLSEGEVAVCDSNFTSSAALSGKNHRIDSTHAMLTVTGAKVTLQANIAIWTPIGATEHVIEHEKGHQQISEYYYQTADKLAEQIAETYVGRQVPIAGTDLDGEANTELQELARQLTEEYGKQLNPDPAQELYDTITDHSRNETLASDAVANAIKDAEITTPHPVADAQN